MAGMSWFSDERKHCERVYSGEICLENASCYGVIAPCTQRSIGVLLTILKPCTNGDTLRVRTRAKVVISCSTFSNVDQGYTEESGLNSSQKKNENNWKITRCLERDTDSAVFCQCFISVFTLTRPS